MSPNDFIDRMAPAAMDTMRGTRIPASLTIAQAILESGWGESGLTNKANNLFGIKGVGPAGSVPMPTKEYAGGQWITVTAWFRAYHTWSESIADHAQLLLAGTRDKPARYHGVLGADYRTACYAIWSGGYATDPAYPDKLIKLIEHYKLGQYDFVEEDARMIQELQKQIEQLAEDNRQMQGKLAKLEQLHSMPVPGWAQDAVDAAVESGLVDTPHESSFDFYRFLTVLYRMDKRTSHFVERFSE